MTHTAKYFFIISHLYNLDFLAQSGYSDVQVWLGGTDARLEDTWEWTDGSAGRPTIIVSEPDKPK